MCPAGPSSTLLVPGVWDTDTDPPRGCLSLHSHTQWTGFPSPQHGQHLESLALDKSHSGLSNMLNTWRIIVFLLLRTPFSSLDHYFIRLFLFFILSSLYIYIYTSKCYQISIWLRFFFHSVGCLFTFEHFPLLALLPEHLELILYRKPSPIPISISFSSSELQI